MQVWWNHGEWRLGRTNDYYFTHKGENPLLAPWQPCAHPEFANAAAQGQAPPTFSVLRADALSLDFTAAAAPAAQQHLTLIRSAAEASVSVGFTLPAAAYPLPGTKSECPWLGIFPSGSTALCNKDGWYRCTAERDCEEFQWDGALFPGRGSYTALVVPRGGRAEDPLCRLDFAVEVL